MAFRGGTVQHCTVFSLVGHVGSDLCLGLLFAPRSHLTPTSAAAGGEFSCGFLSRASFTSCSGPHWLDLAVAGFVVEGKKACPLTFFVQGKLLVIELYYPPAALRVKSSKEEDEAASPSTPPLFQQWPGFWAVTVSSPLLTLSHDWVVAIPVVLSTWDQGFFLNEFSLSSTLMELM